MSLEAGARLGPYQVESALGAGGMGEVYRARDLRLGRAVALKVIRPDRVDAERRQRFEREARAAAAVNHPNLLAVFDVGVESDCSYIVSELLDGQSLRQRLAAGTLPVRKAVDYAVQIAEGIAAAHEAGIVHRDLKPDNIFVTTDGRAKVLDFGLARLREAASPMSGDDEAATLSRAGVLVGTVGYMAPEQVRGGPADARSDIFALGMVLYEMLSGRRAFRAQSAAEVLNAILNLDPPPLSATGRAVAPGLERIVRRCLEKSPAERFQSARDLAFALQSVGSDASDTSRPGLPRSRRGGLPFAVAAGLLLAVALGSFALGRRGGRPEQPTMQRLTYRRGTVRGARFMPDGETILYGAAWDGDPFQVFSTRFDSEDSRPCGFPDAQLLSISSKGEPALLLAPRGGLWAQEAGTLAVVQPGGSPRPLADHVVDADWSRDGESLAVVRLDGFERRLEFPVDRIVYRASVLDRGGFAPAQVRVSHDGRMLGVLEHALDPDYGRVVIFRGGTRATTSRPFSSIIGLSWSADDRELWFTAAPAGGRRALYAIDTAGRERLVLRAPGQLTLKDISRQGRVLLTRDEEIHGIRGQAPGSDAERELTWYSWSLLVALSADGRTLAFSEGGEAFEDRWGSYLRGTDGSPAVRLGDGLAQDLSDDGQWVLASAQWNADPTRWPRLFLLPTGPERTRLLTRPGGPLLVPLAGAHFVPGNRAVVYDGQEGGRPSRVYYQPIDGEARPVTPEGVVGVFFSGGMFGSGPLPTPDGRYVLAAQGDGRLALYPIEGGEAIPLRPLPGAILGWHDDGKRLRLADAADSCRILVGDPRTGRTELFRQYRKALDPAGLVGGGCPSTFSADGRAYAYSYSRHLSDLYLVEGLREQ